MNYFDVNIAKNEINEKNTLALSHLGDGVYELAVRAFLCLKHSFSSEALHRETLKFVSASAQAHAFSMIRESLSEEENAIFLRGRNAHVRTVPKSCTRAEYHTATGLEALIGYLYLAGRTERISELMTRIFDGFTAETQVNVE